MKLLFYFLFLFSVFSYTYSQEWFYQNNSPKSNFYEIRNDFLKSWGNKSTEEKGQGWKPFKRWEWFWEPRVAPSGEFPNLLNYYLYCKKIRYIEKSDKTNKIQSTKAWSYINPYKNTDSFQGTGRINVVAVNPSNSNYIYAGSASGGLWISTDNGVNWITTTDELGSIGISDIAIDYNNPSTIYIATGDRDHGDTRSIGVLKSTDNGNTWNTTGLTFNTSSYILIHRLLIHPVNPNILYAATNNGLYISTNYGNTWNRPFTNSVGDLQIKPNNPQVMYLVNSTRIYRSTDGGTNWSQLTNGLPTTNIQRIKLAVTPANNNYIYAIYSNSNSEFLGLYRSTDGGTNWSLKSNSPNILGWSSNGTGTGGQAWYDLAIAASEINPELVYIGGINVWYSTNGGTNWTYFNNSMHVDIHHLYFIPGADVLYCGNDGGIYRKASGQTTWTWLGSSLQTTQFYRLGTSETVPTMIIAGSQDNGTKLHSSTTVKNVYGGDGMECIIDYSNANYMYACSQNGGLGRSTNGGTSFSTIIPSGSTGQWVTPYVLSPSNPQVIYAGFQEIYKSTNRGTNWTTISNFGSTSGMNFLHVAPSNENYIYCGKYTGFFRKTTNGGASWISLSYPTTSSLTYLAIHYDDPNKIWACFSGYTSNNKVYYSSNGGTTWQNLTLNLPNVPCNTIVYQKNSPNRVFVGTDIGVWYKDDFTTNWVEYNDNLPNVVIDELEINYASGKLRAATFGRGLWEVSLPDLKLNPQLTGNDSLCCKSIAIYKTNRPENTSIQWYVTNGRIIGLNTLDSVIVQWDTLNTGSVKVVHYNHYFSIYDSNKLDIKLYDLPKPAISGNNQICCGDTVIYKSYSTNISNKWYVTNGKIIGSTTLPELKVIWSDSCNNTNIKKSVKLVQTNQNGCKDSTELLINTNPLPTISLTGNLNVCEGKEYTYLYDYKPFNQYSLNVKNGIFNIIDNGKFSIKWDSLTTGEIKVSIKNTDNNCFSEKIFKVNITKMPKMNITGDLSACSNRISNYFTSTDLDYSIKWEVFGGIIQDANNNTTCKVRWTSSENAKITLIKTHKTNLCSDTITKSIIINPSPDVKISGLENTYQNSTNTYQNNLISNERITWKVENGSITKDNGNSIDVFWGKFPNGKITLIKENLQTGCKDTNFLNVKLNVYHTFSIKGSNAVCLGDTTIFTSEPIKDDIQSSWLVDNAEIIQSSNNSIKIHWIKDGNFKLQLIRNSAKNNFNDTAFIIITVNKLPPKPILKREGNKLVSSSDVGNQWYKDGKLINHSGKEYLPDSDGNYYVVVVSPTTDCKSQRSDIISFKFVNIIEDLNDELIRINPNPNNGEFNINFFNKKFNNLKLSMTDNNSKLIYSNTFNYSENINLNINVSSGLYFIIFDFDNNERIYKKLLINK